MYYKLASAVPCRLAYRNHFPESDPTKRPPLHHHPKVTRLLPTPLCRCLSYLPQRQTFWKCQDVNKLGNDRAWSRRFRQVAKRAHTIRISSSNELRNIVAEDIRIRAFLSKERRRPRLYHKPTDSLPTEQSHPRTTVLLVADPQAPRYPRPSSLLRRELLDSLMHTRSQRRNTTSPFPRRASIDVPGGRSLRFSQHLRTNKGEIIPCIHSRERKRTKRRSC